MNRTGILKPLTLGNYVLSTAEPAKPRSPDVSLAALLHVLLALFGSLCRSI
jgi:hypothetical protein